MLKINIIQIKFIIRNVFKFSKIRFDNINSHPQVLDLSLKLTQFKPVPFSKMTFVFLDESKLILFINYFYKQIRFGINVTS